MIGYIIQRLFAILAILVVMSMLIFGITQILPGNVAYVIAGQFATPDVVQAIELKLGLNDPVYVQYWRWASGILRGDLGQSLVMERPVAPIIADAEAAGAKVFTREQIRDLGVKGVLERMPKLGNVFVTIDIDGLDPSIAPGTGSPTVDGLLYHEVRGLLQGVSKMGKVVGFDLVEVNPMVDHYGQTCLLASTLILEFLGAIFASQGRGLEA